MKEKLDITKLKHREYYEILFNGAGIITLTPSDGVWIASFKMCITSSIEADEALISLREHLKLGIKNINETLGVKR